MPTYAQQLHRRLEEVVELTDRLLEVSGIDYDPDKIKRLSRETGIGILAIIPNSTWQPLHDEGRRRQRTALDHWQGWIEQVRLLFSGDSEHSRRQLEKAASKVTDWLDRSSTRDFSVPKKIEEAKDVFRRHVAPLFDLLAPFQVDGPLVVVPDTNVLIRNQLLPSWAETLGTDEFTVLLVPGVVTEIDEHKLTHRVPQVREKARKFSSRIKGWRKQGRLRDGVRVQQEIFIKLAAREPDFENTLSWLDPTITDDRIIASVLEFQRNNPMTDVRLLSGDSIMLAKADEAGVPTDDVPDRQ